MSRFVRSAALAVVVLPLVLIVGIGPLQVQAVNASSRHANYDADDVADPPDIEATESQSGQSGSGRGATPASLPGRSFTAKLTAYAHGSRTASGTPVRWGVVAVDPRVIPLGSRIMIEGFDNVFVAEDTGGGVRGNHVDIYFTDVASAIRFGVQHRTVTVLPL